MKKNRAIQITLIGSSEATSVQKQVAYEIGIYLAEQKYILISGGRGGVMKAAAKAVKEKGGISVGILPSEKLEDGNEYNTITIPTGIGFARNSMNVLAADIVIAVGGGAGTLSEIAFAWCYSKIVCCYTGADGWAKELSETNLDKRQQDLLLPFSTIDELDNLIQKNI